jgi:hypothetical protein
VRHCCRVTLTNMYGMNQAYNAGGGDPSAQVPNHLVSGPAALQGSSSRTDNTARPCPPRFVI